MPLLAYWYSGSCAKRGHEGHVFDGILMIGTLRDAERRSIIGELILRQHRACYLDLHRATARERYELLLQRCPGIVEHLALQDLASFLRPVGSKRPEVERLCITPQMLSRIRKNISFGAPK